MTPEQQRKILKAAAKACGISGSVMGSGDIIYEKNGVAIYWNPSTNSADTASMCAKLDINTFFYMTIPKVECSAEDAGDEQTIRYTVSHNGTQEGKEAAWRLAASMVAAKVGGYEDA